MHPDISHYFTAETSAEPVATAEQVNAVQSGLDFILPADYVELVLAYNGWEGEIGEESWLCLFPLEDLVQVNINYRLLMEQIPDYFLFGKDAAEGGYAFHKTNHTYHEFGLMSNFKTDSMHFYGNNLREFLEHLYEFRD